MKKTSPHRMAGVTMMELLIVLAIVAMLAAFAINSYRQYILRGNRTYATRALQDLASREESYYFNNNAYTSSLSNLAASSSAPNTGTTYYTISVASASSSDYTVQAVPVGTQTQDTQCTLFTLTRAGVQNSTGTGTAQACWQSSH